ncbi:MAG: hypothetical protein IAE90_05070 [Ignavibacteria bacterium]|nr:hypothetical protein [Ignavibacteria bacterium]
MEKSTLIEILRTFSTAELASFGDFAASPYFNKKSNVLKLYECLKTFSPEYPAEKIAKEEIWKKIFPGKKYNYGIMKNLIHDLNKLTVKFIEHEAYSQKPVENDLNLLDGYKLRNLKSQFIKKAADMRKKLKTRPLDHLTHYYSYMIYLSEMNYLDYTLLFDSKEKDYHSEVNRSLFLFYCSNQLYLNVNNLQYVNNSSALLDKETHSKTLKFYEDSPFKDPFADITYQSYFAMSNVGDRAAYEKLKAVFFENYFKCSKTIQYDLAVTMLNFCTICVKIGIKAFVEDEFLYIKLLIEDGLYKASTVGWMDQYLFMQSVMSACRAGRFDWAEKFIKEHNHELIEDLREQYTNYAYITLNLRRGRFKDALHYISKCRNIYEGDKLNIKVFEFNAYYELGYYDELKALADSANHMLRNDKFFSKENKANYKLYVTAISKLMDYKCKVGSRYKDPDFLPNLVEFINGNQMLNKQWLLQKAEELK